MPDIAQQKKEIRNRLRKARVEYAASLPAEISALVFHRPPAAVLDLVPDDAVIGFYRADPGEAPANSYAKFFFERGHTIALPWLVDLQTPMIFRQHTDPYGESDLAKGYFNLMQGSEDAPEVVPDVLFMPLVAFTPHGHRLGQAAASTTNGSAHIPTRSASGSPGTCRKCASCPTNGMTCP